MGYLYHRDSFGGRRRAAAAVAAAAAATRAISRHYCAWLSSSLLL